MKKQFVIIGVIAILVCVGLSGCNSETEKDLENNRTGMPFLPPDFRVSGLTVMDDCERVYPDLGTAYVNFTVTNHGSPGARYAFCRVYQGIENFQLCGNGIIYNNTRSSYLQLENEESKQVSFVFPGIDCTNGTGCWGYEYWISESSLSTGP
ncbi:MAG TPA: hypothetical protein VN377_03685 [Candidatus Thermoplasmatota archaeon]|nr:hypothetical protein [Candidatus Thermoplasmatota archaeon]